MKVIAVEHQKLHLLQPGQRTVMDPADAVEPTGAKKLQSRQSFNTHYFHVVYLCTGLHAFSYPKFMRRVCAGRPGGMLSRERKVQ